VTDLTYRSSMYKHVPSGMSAPLSRRRKAERIGLMPDGVREFAHDAGCDAEHFQERDRRAACLLARLDRKECRDLATHLHFWVRGITEQLHDYCALVTQTPIDSQDTIVGDLYGQLQCVVCDPQPHRWTSRCLSWFQKSWRSRSARRSRRCPHLCG